MPRANGLCRGPTSRLSAPTDRLGRRPGEPLDDVGKFGRLSAAVELERRPADEAAARRWPRPPADLGPLLELAHTGCGSRCHPSTVGLEQDRAVLEQVEEAALVRTVPRPRCPHGPPGAGPTRGSSQVPSGAPTPWSVSTVATPRSLRTSSTILFRPPTCPGPRLSTRARPRGAARPVASALPVGRTSSAAALACSAYRGMRCNLR